MNLAQIQKLAVLATVLFVLIEVNPHLRAADTGAAAPASSVALQAMSFTLEGKITQHTAGKLTVSTEENIVFHVTYGEKTEIKRHDGSPGSEKDLQVGVRIRVEGDLAESGEIAAQKIEIEPASGQK